MDSLEGAPRDRKQLAAGALMIAAIIHCRNVCRRRFEQRRSAMAGVAGEVQQGLIEGAPAKSTWVRDMLMHHTDTWDTTVFPQYDDGQFWKDFRCSKATFEWLCFKIFKPCGFEGNRSGPNWRVISLRRRVAMLLWRLLHGGREHAIAKIFFCDQSTVNKIVHKGLSIIAKHWTDAFITWPAGKRARDITSRFHQETSLPDVIAVVDGSHIPITTPSIDRSNYFNDKCFHSMILMAAVDCYGFFVEIDAGLCGSMHDSQALMSSRIAKRAAEGLLHQEGLYLLGDSAFDPPKPWLLTPYSSGQLTGAQMAFNQQLASARVCVERAFCELKSRFRVLLKKMEGDLDTTVQMIGVCCTLHNMMLSRDERGDPEWIAEAKVALEGIRDAGTLQHLQQQQQLLHQQVVVNLNAPEHAAGEVVIAVAGLQELEAVSETSEPARLARATEPVPLPAGFNTCSPEEIQRARELRDEVAEGLFRRKRLRSSG